MRLSLVALSLLCFRKIWLLALAWLRLKLQCLRCKRQQFLVVANEIVQRHCSLDVVECFVHQGTVLEFYLESERTGAFT